MKRLRLILAFSLLICAAVSTFADELVYRSYEMEGSLPPDELARLRGLAGKDGRVIRDADTSKLMVIATTNAHDQIALRIAKVQTNTDKNVRIDVTFRRIGSATESVTRIDPSGKLVFRPGAPRPGPRFQATLKTQRSGHELKRQTTTDSSVTRQSLTVLNNREAVLFVGTEVIFSDWLLEYAVAHRLVAPTFTMRNVGSRLVIAPTIGKSGDIITLTITPELTGLVGFNRERIRYTGVSTVVKVRNGATLHIGGAAKDKEFYDRFLVGVDRNGNKEKTDITVTPHIINARGKAVPR